MKKQTVLAADEAKTPAPNTRVTAASTEYDRNRQFTQLDNLIAAGVKMILITAIDQNAVRPAKQVTLMLPTLVDRQNVGSHVGSMQH